MRDHPPIVHYTKEEPRGGGGPKKLKAKGGVGGFSMKSGGVFYQYSILMYPAVFRCILLKYCILAYSDVFQNVFSYLLVCDRDTLCFMYSDVFCMYSTCILRRGRDTSRYTYPLTHLRGTSPSAGLGTSPSLRSLGSAPSGFSLEWGGVVCGSTAARSLVS